MRIILVSLLAVSLSGCLATIREPLRGQGEPVHGTNGKCREKITSYKQYCNAGGCYSIPDRRVRECIY